MHKFAVKELANFFLTFSVIGNLNLCMMATEVVNFYCESWSRGDIDINVISLIAFRPPLASAIIRLSPFISIVPVSGIWVLPRHAAFTVE
jgi:hypothetical protein